MDVKTEYENGNLIVRTPKTYVFFGGTDDYLHIQTGSLDVTIGDFGGGPQVILTGVKEPIRSGNCWIFLNGNESLENMAKTTEAIVGGNNE